MLSKRAFKLYLRYKAHSNYLFTNPSWKNIEGLASWSDDEIEAYKKQLADGYVANLRCASARKEYRDTFVPVLDQDEGHEKAIQEAERLCVEFGMHLSALQKAVQRQKAALRPDRGGRVSPDPSSEFAHVIHDRVDATSPVRPCRASVDDWMEMSKGVADQESEAEMLAGDIYEALYEFTTELRMKDEEVGGVILAAIRWLAPSTECTWGLHNPRTVKALHALFRKTGLPPKAELRTIVIRVAVAGRKQNIRLADALKSTCKDVEKLAAPIVDKFSAIGADGLKIAKTAMLFYAIRTLKESSGSYGSNQIMINSIVDVIHFSKTLSEPHSLRSALLLRKLPDKFFENAKEVVLASFVCPKARSLTLPADFSPSQSKRPPDMKQCQRLFNSFMKRCWTGADMCAARLSSLARACMLALEGTLPAELAVQHPALYLHRISVDTVTPRAVRTFKKRILDAPVGSPVSLSWVVTLVKDITSCAEIMLDVQYFDHYERYIETGEITPEMIRKNPFTDDKKNLVNAVGKLAWGRTAYAPAKSGALKLIIKEDKSSEVAPWTIEVCDE